MLMPADLTLNLRWANLTFLFGLRIELDLETEFDAVDSARSKVDFVESEFELEIGSL